MSSVKENYNLFKHNTFQVAAYTRFFIELKSTDEIVDFLKSDYPVRYPWFILGGGSNVLFTKDFEGVIIHPYIKGIEKTFDDGQSVIIRSGAGEIWDELVEFCVNNNWGGIENLAMIPGTAGASPVQNIGAYGTEVMDYIDSVECYQFKNAKKIVLKAKDCMFSYRNSIFKNELKNKVIITHVNFRLYKNHRLNTCYPDLKKEMDNYSETTIQTIRQAIISIRKNKLPDPAITGNAGSFFKNPVLQYKEISELQKFYPALPIYKMPDGSVKLSAAWLIDQSGWKGKRFGNAGTHKKQPLILINYGNASGQEILQCAQKIQKAVMNHFAIKLEMEVNVL